MRTLTKAEIEQLQAQHCIATDWSLIEVAEPFHPEYVQDVYFSGKIRIKDGSPIKNLKPQLPKICKNQPKPGKNPEKALFFYNFFDPVHIIPVSMIIVK